MAASDVMSIVHKIPAAIGWLSFPTCLIWHETDPAAVHLVIGGRGQVQRRFGRALLDEWADAEQTPGRIVGDGKIRLVNGKRGTLDICIHTNGLWTTLHCDPEAVMDFLIATECRVPSGEEDLSARVEELLAGVGVGS